MPVVVVVVRNGLSDTFAFVLSIYTETRGIDVI